MNHTRCVFLKLLAVIILVFDLPIPDGKVYALSFEHNLVRTMGIYVDDQILVRFNPTSPQGKIQNLLQEADATIVSDISNLGVFILDIPKGEVESTIRELRRRPEILLAEPNYYVYADDIIPSDPGFGSQYGLINIRAPQGWDLSTGATWVTIAVIDTGVDLSHPELAYKTIQGYDFVNNDDVPQDDNGHGTHVAGIAAAASNNGVGITGVSWGANIMPLKVLNSAGNGTYADVASAIVWATDHGAQVINMSLGGSFPSSVLEDAVNYAYARGMVQVAAAGNSGSGTVLYPAHYAPVIAVAATDNFNSHAGFSNYGPEVDLAAPGVLIYSLYPGGGYGYRSGTSMAAPFVAGLASILIGLPGNYDAGFVENQMESTALDLGAAGWDVYYGAGLIQMDAAIQLATPPTPTPTMMPTATATFTATSTATTTSTQTLTPTKTSTPIRHIRTKTPTPLPWNWFPRISPSPTYTSTPTPSITLSLVTQMDGVSVTDSETPTSTAALASGPNKNIATPWTLCMGISFTLTGILLWIYARSGRQYRRKKSKFLKHDICHLVFIKFIVE